MPARLFNNLADALVIIGLDEHTGIFIGHAEDSSFGQPHDGIIFKSQLQAQVLCAISSRVAVYPCRKDVTQAADYPPRPDRHAASASGSSDATDDFRPPAASSRLPPPRLSMMPRSSIRPGSGGASSFDTRSSSVSGLRRASVAGSGGATAAAAAASRESAIVTSKSADMPMSREDMDSLCRLCFHDGMRAYSDAPPGDSVRGFVMTDIAGKRRYAAMLTFYRKFHARRRDTVKLYGTVVGGGGGAVASDGGSGGSPSHGVHYDLVPDYAPRDAAAGVACHLPVCCVLVSKYAYHTALQDALCRLHVELRGDPAGFDRLAKSFAHLVTGVPVPLPGVVDLGLQIGGGLNVFMPAPRHYATPVVDLPLRLLFGALSPPSVCAVVAWLLTEQRVVFTAANPALPLVVAESLLALVSPFVWVAPYVPLLSVDMIECVEAPGYFLFGLDARHCDAVKDIDGLVVVDLDRDAVRAHSDVPRLSLPARASADFCERALRIQTSFDAHCVGRVIESVQAERRRFQERTNAQILSAGNMLMVDLFKGVLDHLRDSFFDRQEFLSSVPADDRPFYDAAVQTTMFSNFLKQRVDMAASGRRDPWQNEAERQRSLVQGRRASALPIGPTDEVNALTVEHVVFELPAVCRGGTTSIGAGDLREFYADAALNARSYADVSKDRRVQLSCLCLTGLLKIAADREVEGLNDLFKLFEKDPRWFPKLLIEELLMSLEDSEAERVMSQLSYRQFYVDLLEKARERRSSMGDAFIKVELSKIPSRYVNRDEFVKYFERLDLVVDRDTAQRVFNALTLGGVTDQVSPEAFKEFYGCWKDSELQRKEFESVLTDKVHCKDRILKVSPLVRTDYGNGRLILTERRISFLGEASSQARQVVAFERIEKLEKASKKAFLGGETATLLIVPRRTGGGGDDAERAAGASSDAKPFTAVLKGDRNQWYVLIKEMWHGRVRATDLKDPFVAQHAAQNVLLLDALISSAESDWLTHARNLDRAVQLLSLYGAAVAPPPMPSPPAARDTLMYRVNPNAEEKITAAVDCLLFVAGESAAAAAHLLAGHVGEAPGAAPHGTGAAGKTSGGGGEWDASRPTLWCGLANGKIRTFDAGNWKLNRSYIQAEGRVVCMTAVSGGRIWAGSFDHNIYVIESGAARRLQYHCLREHDDYVTDVVATPGGGYVYSASINGRIIKFNAAEESVVSAMSLQTTSLIGLVVDGDELWCNTRDRIVRVSGGSGGAETLTVLQYFDEEQRAASFDTFLVIGGDVWAGCASHGRLVVWSRASGERHAVLPLDCPGVSRMAAVRGSVWVGCKASATAAASSGGGGGTFATVSDGTTASASAGGDGYRPLESKLYVLSVDSYCVGSVFDAHFDTIRSVCTAADKYVVTGSGSCDGRIAIWCYQADLATPQEDDIAGLMLDALTS